MKGTIVSDVNHMNMGVRIWQKRFPVKIVPVLNGRVWRIFFGPILFQ